MIVREIVEKYLKDNGFDGLYNADGDCSCGLDDFIPCGDVYDECEAGYKVPCDCGNHDFHIQKKKPKDGK